MNFNRSFTYIYRAKLNVWFGHGVVCFYVIKCMDNRVRWYSKGFISLSIITITSYDVGSRQQRKSNSKQRTTSVTISSCKYFSFRPILFTRLTMDCPKWNQHPEMLTSPNTSCRAAALTLAQNLPWPSEDWTLEPVPSLSGKRLDMSGASCVS